MPSRNRGKRKPTLRDLSRVHPTREEVEALRDAFSQATAHPITAAVIGAVMIEHQIESMLQQRLPRKDDDTWETLTQDDGPLRSFYTKIATGYALRMYDERMRDALDIVRHVRNAFAHSKKPLRFDHPLVIKELRKALKLGYRSVQPFLRDDLHDLELNSAARYAYVALCFELSGRLYKTEARRYRASSNWYKRKTAKMWARQHPFAAALLPFLEQPTGGKVAGLASPPVRQTGGPMPGVHARPQTRLGQMVATPDGKKDK